MKRMFIIILFHVFNYNEEIPSSREIAVEINLKKDLESTTWTLIGIKACATHIFLNTVQYKYQLVYKINDIVLNDLAQHLL